VRQKRFEVSALPFSLMESCPLEKDRFEWHSRHSSCGSVPHKRHRASENKQVVIRAVDPVTGVNRNKAKSEAGCFEKHTNSRNRERGVGAWKKRERERNHQSAKEEGSQPTQRRIVKTENRELGRKGGNCSGANGKTRAKTERFLVLAMRKGGGKPNTTQK